MKKFLSLLLVVCMVLSLAACGKKEEQKPQDNQGVVQQTPEVSDDVNEPVSDSSEEPSTNLGDEDRVQVDIPVATDQPDESQAPDDTQDDKSLFDGDTEPDDSEEEPDEEEPPVEPDKSKVDTEAGEKAIFESMFEGGATEQAIRDMLHVNGSQVSYEVIQETIVLLNEYSTEGVKRFIVENDRFSGISQDTQNAVVLVWRILGYEPKELWESAFMSERLVTAVWDVLDSAEDQYQKSLEQNNGR